MKPIARWFLPILLVSLCACASNRQSSPDSAEEATGSPRLSFVADRTPWSYQGRPGWHIRTPSVDLYTTTDDRLLRMRLPDFLELAHAHRLTAITPLRPGDTSLETYILGTRSEWDSMTRRLLGDRARPYLRIERGGYSANGKGIFYDLGPRDTFVMAAHEGWHQYVQTSFADPLPVWLDEGLACFMEGFRWRIESPDRPEFLPWSNQERFDQLRRAVGSRGIIPLRDLVNARPQDLIDTDRGGSAALNYYAQSWALVHFLNESEGGMRRTGLERLLRDAQAGRFVDAVRQAAGEREAGVLRTRRTGSGSFAAYWPDESIEKLDASFRTFIARIVATGGRDLAIAGRSPYIDR